MIQRLTDTFGLTTTQAQLVVTAAIIVLLFVIRAVVVAIVHRRIDDAAVWYKTRKALTYTITAIGLIVVASIWFDGSGFVTYIGFLTAALAIALSDVVKNLAGWLFIVLRRPFRLGDRIELDGHTGDVVDIRVFSFTMLEVGGRVRQVTGSMLHMPNGKVFTEALTNYSQGFSYIWHEIPVLVTFESDWEGAEELVLEAVKEASAVISPEQVAQQLRQTATEYRFHITDLAPSTIVTVEDSGILVTGRLLVAARGGRRAAEQKVWRYLLKAFAGRDDIDLAYPTIRTYFDGPLDVKRSGDA